MGSSNPLAPHEEGARQVIEVLYIHIWSHGVINTVNLMFRGILHNPTLLNMAKDEKGILLDMWIFSKVNQKILLTIC